MKRAFLIEEIMLDGVSGEVRGTIDVDLQSGTIDHIGYESFCFRRDDSDYPTLLEPAQMALAESVVQRVLERESDLSEGSLRLVASGESYSPPVTLSTATCSPACSPGTQILAEYLQSAGQRERPVEETRRAQ